MNRSGSGITRYGRVTGRVPIFQALATLAWEPRRADYFRRELFDALDAGFTLLHPARPEAEPVAGIVFTGPPSRDDAIRRAKMRT